MLVLATAVILDTGKKNAGCLRFKQPRTGKNATLRVPQHQKPGFTVTIIVLQPRLFVTPGFTAVPYAAARVETSSRIENNSST